MNLEKRATVNEESRDLGVDDFELPLLITGKVVEMTTGGMNMLGHAGDCDFLGHLPPAASYQLVELDLSTSQPSVSEEARAKFAKQLNTREKARANKAAKEKKYNDRVEKQNTKKFDLIKEQVLGDSGFVRRPS